MLYYAILLIQCHKLHEYGKLLFIVHRNRIFLRPDTTVRLGADADGENSNPPALQPADPAPPPEAPPLRRSPRNVHFAATLHTYRYFDD